MTNVDRIHNATNRINKICTKLDHIHKLFGHEAECIRNGIRLQDVSLETVYETPSMTITIARYKKSGAELPMHAHKDSVEFLISSKGVSLLKLPSSLVRVLGQGECASIPIGVEHTTAAMTDNAEVIAICVPPEEAYRLRTPNGHH